MGKKEHTDLHFQALKTGTMDLSIVEWDAFPGDVIRVHNDNGEARWYVTKKQGDIVWVTEQ